MKINITYYLTLVLLSFSIGSSPATAKPAAPYTNPYLANSTYPLTHARASRTPLVGPKLASRRLRNDEIQHVATGPISGWAPAYSGLYPNGQRVIWIAGYDRVAKIDADTLEVLTALPLIETTPFNDAAIEAHIATMDALDDKARANYGLNIRSTPFKSVESVYHLLSNDHEYYVAQRSNNGAVALQVYGELDATNPASAIELRRQWVLPPEISKSVVTSVNMTSDGWLVMTTQDGVIIALSRDLKTQHVLKLPRTSNEAVIQDFWSSYVRNGIVTDDKGGIYVVTREKMHRIQWTGKKLSMASADGAWSVSYSNETGLGCGTTPALMGWGENEDHLVVIADASQNNQMMALWRDKIPSNWQGIAGYDRRVAGVIPIQFGVSKTERVQIENTPIIYGYGAFFNNTYPEQRLPDQGSPTKQWMMESAYMNVPQHEAKGGAMIRWNAQTRQLQQAWQSQVNFVSTVCTVSEANNILYCWGARDHEWTIEGTHWHTGNNAFHLTLGSSERYNPLGGPVVISPNGDIDCGCAGGMGILRVSPTASLR